MNDLGELAQFALVHARAQQIAPDVCAGVLGRISHDEPGDGSWAAEWSRAAAQARAAGDPLAASRLYTMARFPYCDGPARQEAQELARASFADWREAAGAPLTRLDVQLDGGLVRCWTTGLRTGPGAAAPPDRPVVVLMGGIVSTKEQWAPTLLRLRRFGLCGIVAELPGVGENTLPYAVDNGAMLSAVLDAAGIRRIGGGRAAVPVYALAMSFSGHLALQCALADPRITGLITVGAPVHAFFARPEWHRRLPRVTVDTLAHLMGRPDADLGTVSALLAERALPLGRLRDLRLPVAYVSSRRDEVIPAMEIDFLRQWAGRLDLIEFDDVHASPAHTAVTGPWLVHALLRMDRSRPVQRAALRLALPVLKAATAVQAGRAARASAPSAIPPPAARPGPGARRAVPAPSSQKGS
ncbi:MAG TPA: alpha/beta hydrolase [Actinocrinis sp.]